MIVTFTANPALDVTYRTAELRLGAEHRVAAPVVRAGGKGINVARTLRALGHDPLVLAPAGGPEGEVLRAGLERDGVAHRLVPVAGATRRTVTVVDAGGTATGLNETGPGISGPEWEALRAQVRAALRTAGVLVLSGSLPPGLPVDAYGVLAADARGLGVPVVVDTSGAALSAASAAGPALVKPNAAELRAATGIDVTGVEGVVRAARALIDAGAGAVLASLGADGMVLVPGRDAAPLHCRPPAGVAVVNPTGAGDAAVAAAAAGLEEGLGWPQLLHRAVAWSVAAVAEPEAGAVDPRVAADLARRIPLPTGATP
jgi:tagatose 6-phosphate kinase